VRDAARATALRGTTVRCTAAVGSAARRPAALAAAALGTTARHARAGRARVTTVIGTRFGAALPIPTWGSTGVAGLADPNARTTCATGTGGLEGLTTAGLEPNTSEEQRDGNTATNFEGKHVPLSVARFRREFLHFRNRGKRQS
jgi:hypothetical protein